MPRGVGRRLEEQKGMKPLTPVLLGVTLTGLAVAVGAVLGYFALVALQFAYAAAAGFWTKTDNFATYGIYRIHPLAGVAVGAAAGIPLGIWLTRRLLAAWRAR